MGVCVQDQRSQEVKRLCPKRRSVERHPEGRRGDPRAKTRGRRSQQEARCWWPTGETRDRTSKENLGDRAAAAFSSFYYKILSTIYVSQIPSGTNLGGRVESNLRLVWKGRSCPLLQLDNLSIERDPKRIQVFARNPLPYFSGQTAGFCLNTK